jgi:hypothetical protein
MYEVSERLEITYTYGLSTNAVLQRASEELLAEAVRLWDETHAPQRLFAGFWYRAGSWCQSQPKSGPKAQREVDHRNGCRLSVLD